MWLNQDSLARSLTHVASTPEVRIHIYPLFPSPESPKNILLLIRERIAKIFLFFPYEINAQVILVTTTCYIISGDGCSKKREKKKDMRK